jgi:hypothetical protein
LVPKAEHALSLRLLQEQLALCSRAGTCLTDPKTLYGLTRFGGYVIDKPNRDIVLFGEQQPGQPPLDVDDFIIALRNLNRRYAEVQGNVRHISYPGISIDPMAETLREIAQISRALGQNRGREAVEQAIGRWQQVCAAPQQVRVMGVPRPSHFARVMLDADYRLKQITDGTDRLEVSGLTSIMDNALAQAIDAVYRKESIDLSSTSRFWFIAGPSYYSSGRTTFTINRVDVELRTEVLNSRLGSPWMRL